jgi:hypothetical protein
LTGLLSVAALVGATLIVVRGTIFRPVRKLWPALLHCSQCTGFWVGVAAGGLGLAPFGRGPIVDAIVVGCATSFLAQLADAVFIQLLGEPLE